MAGDVAPKSFYICYSCSNNAKTCQYIVQNDVLASHHRQLRSSKHHWPQRVQQPLWVRRDTLRKIHSNDVFANIQAFNSLIHLTVLTISASERTHIM